MKRTLPTWAAALTLAGVLLAGGAHAQTQAVTSKSTITRMSHASTTTGSADKTAVSKDCSAQADAKNLHGKERKRFRSSCKHQKT